MGEYGADVCLHRDDIARSFPNEDLRLIRIEVDEERNLRRVDTGAFVRNVVDADPSDDADLVGRMLSDIPADATEEDLHVSALFHSAVPPAFVRLDDPDGETVVSKVLALDTEANKHKLLWSLAQTVQSQDVSEEVLTKIDRILTELQRLDDEDGLDQYIEQNFL